MNDKTLLYSIGQYIQYLVTIYNGKESVKDYFICIYIYILNYFTVHEKHNTINKLCFN